MAGKTLVEKIVARAAGVAAVSAGELVTAKVDLAFAHDSSGPRRWAPMLAEMGAGVWDASKVVVVSDHYAPAADPDSAEILKVARDFARRHDVFHFDMVGVCHTVLAESGRIRPGAFIAGGDSHTPMAGAFGAYAAGYGATDMAAIVATGETWLSTPATVKLSWSGRLSRGVTAKDIMLMLVRRLGMGNAFRAMEFCGPTIEAMSMEERMVLCNMAAELGAETGVVAPDAVTFDYLARAGRPVTERAEAQALRSDDDAVYVAEHVFDVDALTPQVAAPHSPENGGPIGDYAGVAIDQAYIGACVGAKLSDLRMAAEVLRGRTVAPGTRLLVAPASARVTAEAAADGTLATLLEAGAVLLATGCGACAGYGGGVLAAGEVCISSTNRNFQGRMGSAEASVYLASPYAVAAAAVAGAIVDPRELLGAAA